MKYQFSNSLPIYKQIIDKIKFDIISKKIMPGEKLLSIRDYSESFGVTQNTVQKALTMLEQEELIYTERTNGKFITQNVKKIDDMKEKIACKKINQFLQDMKNMGYTKFDIINLINNKGDFLDERE